MDGIADVQQRAGGPVRGTISMDAYNGGILMLEGWDYPIVCAVEGVGIGVADPLWYREVPLGAASGSVRYVEAEDALLEEGPRLAPTRPGGGTCRQPRKPLPPAV